MSHDYYFYLLLLIQHLLAREKTANIYMRSRVVANHGELNNKERNKESTARGA